jgi:hypothetical protein
MQHFVRKVKSLRQAFGMPIILISVGISAALAGRFSACQLEDVFQGLNVNDLCEIWKKKCSHGGHGGHGGLERILELSLGCWMGCGEWNGLKPVSRD